MLILEKYCIVLSLDNVVRYNQRDSFPDMVPSDMAVIVGGTANYPDEWQWSNRRETIFSNSELGCSLPGLPVNIPNSYRSGTHSLYTDIKLTMTRDNQGIWRVRLFSIESYIK